ncbi:MAG: ribose-phosphate diphosphokinase [Gammaproteobacteria bacterium]|nr:ribose-phosphate diphosphokinase [Gammaproteobacteria bacterium]
MIRERVLPVDSNLMVFSGNAHPKLAQDMADYLNVSLGKALISRFSDGEVQVEIQENVRGKDVFVVQPTSLPTNDHIMELLIIVDALRRSSAERITTVIPYFGYSRQDRRVRSIRVPISAKVIANLLSSVGTNRVLTVDLHADQIQGFFDIPVDNIYASPVMLGDIYKRKHSNLIVVSPDVGGVVRARALAKRLDDADLAIIDKRRPKANQAEVMHIIGDVEGKDCFIIDDLVDTAGTLCQAASALKEHGANTVQAYATHPVLSGKAVENIENSELDELVVTDTIALREDARACGKIRQLEVSALIAESMRRINQEESVSTLYMD